MSLTKAEKITALTKKKITLEDVPINIINKLYNDHIVDSAIKKKDVDKTTDKYKILLEFVNGILKNIGKEEINDLRDFKDIYREDILKEENKELLISMQKRLFKYYDKSQCGYYRKTKGFTLNILKGMCKEVGLNMDRKRKQTSKKCVVKEFLLYSIK